MNYDLRKRSEAFGIYICLELKGAIVACGHSQAEVAKGIGRQSANVSKWLNAKPVIPIEVAYEVCEYIGFDLQEIISRAHIRVTEELGPYVPPIGIDPIKAAAENLKGLGVTDFTKAAYRDGNRDIEAETPEE